MRRRPWALVVLAFLHFMAPLGNIIFNAVISNKDVFSYLSHALSAQYLSQNWVIIIAPMVAGAAIYACKKWSFFVYLLAILTLFVFSYSGYMSKAGTISIYPIIFVYLINIVVVGYILFPAVRNVYFDRRLRWWEIQSRYKCDFQCRFTDKEGQNIQQGLVGNISENGLFLKAEHLPEDNEIIIVVLPFENGIELQFQGEVIVHNRVDAVGFGVKFQHTKESKKDARLLVADLESKGMRISRFELRPEDSFIHWARQLVTTGQGLVPEKENKSS